MYVIKDESVVKKDVKDIIVFGTVQDPRIVKIENVVANHFNTTIHELNVFYKDTEAKILTCFLLHDLFAYGISGLAVRYKIDRLFLRNKITQVYINCLSKKADMERVRALRSAYFAFKESH